MSLRPLAAVVVLVLADWGLWAWAISADHGILSLFAGLLMAPLFVALLWMATMTASTIVRAAAELLLAMPRPRPARPPHGVPQVPIEQDERLAA